MRIYNSILLVLIVILGCKRPLSKTSVTALAIPMPIEMSQVSVVFISGFDMGENTYYNNAKTYFEGKGFKVVDTLFSIEEIMGWLDQESSTKIEFDEIHIVSHSNAWSGMALKTTKNGERITMETLREAKRRQQVLAAPNSITKETKVIFHSCGLGENKDLLRELKGSFSGMAAPKVYASSFFNVFGGKFAGHYLARPYYGFYPTAESPGPRQLSEEFEIAYPTTEIDWFKAIKTRRETTSGEAYSYTFNIPVDWEFTFDNAADVPKFKDKEVLMDWISESQEMAEVLFELNIPLEKYRWKYEIQGNKMLIKGKTTALCVLAPILQDKDSNEYRTPTIEDMQLYRIL